MGPIKQESYRQTDGYAPLSLPVGTRVVFTNCYGVSFPGRIIERVEADEKGDAYYLSPSDHPWFPARRDNLTIQYTRP